LSVCVHASFCLASMGVCGVTRQPETFTGGRVIRNRHHMEKRMNERSDTTMVTAWREVYPLQR